MSQRVRRSDAGTLSKGERTPQGGLRAPAFVTRTGVFEYRNADGSIRREYRPPEEVFAPESLASLRSAPVTRDHPKAGRVDSRTFRSLAVGYATDDVRPEGAFVAATVLVQDADTVSDIESGRRREISCGYECDLDWTPGTLPNGERYDAIQRSIRYNHIALVPRGRAGSAVALRLDSEGNQTLSMVKVDGREVELGSAEHLALLEARAMRLQAERDVAVQRADALEREIPARVAARVDALAAAARHGVTVGSSASEDEIRRAVIGKIAPDIRLDGKDSIYVQAAFDTLVSRAATQSRVGVDPPRTPELREDAFSSGPSPDELARQRMMRRGADAWLPREERHETVERGDE